MNQHIDWIMTNNHLEYNSSEDKPFELAIRENIKNKKKNKKSQMVGGNNTLSDDNIFPMGGFPPIYIIDTKKEVVEPATRARATNSKNSSIKIAEIMKNRIDKIAFI